MSEIDQAKGQQWILKNCSICKFNKVGDIMDNHNTFSYNELWNSGTVKLKHKHTFLIDR